MNALALLASMLFLMAWKPPEDSLPCLQLHVDRRTATIGERIGYTVKVFTEQDQQVVVAGQGGILGGFEVKQQGMSERTCREGKISTVTFELANYDVGWDTIPPMVLWIIEGSDTAVLTTEKRVVEIRSVAPDMTGEEDIRALRPQMGMKMPVWQYLALLGVAGLAVAAVLALAWRRRKAASGEPEVKRPPWEVAIEALEELSQQDTSSPPGVKRFYTALSYILRTYCEERFLFPAVEHTTTEILATLRDIPPLRPYLDRTRTFLTRSDLVKFAKYVPPSVDRNEEIGLVKEIVVFTRKGEEEEEGHA